MGESTRVLFSSELTCSCLGSRTYPRLFQIILVLHGDGCWPRLKHAGPVRGPPVSSLLSDRSGDYKGGETEDDNGSDDDTDELKLSVKLLLDYIERNEPTPPTGRPLPPIPPLLVELAAAPLTDDVLETGETEVISPGRD